MPDAVDVCPFCQHPLPPGGSADCPHCARPTSGDGPLAMTCPDCGGRFAITRSMVGHTVACPLCDAAVPTRSETSSAPATTANDASEDQVDDRTKSRQLSEPPTQRQGVADTVRPPSAADRKAPAAGTAHPLLPPRFVVEEPAAGVPDSQPLSPAAQPPATSDNALQIDTRRVRVHLSEQRVPVRALSREEKDQRKKRRVLIVFLGGSLLLILLSLLLSWRW